MAFGAPVTPDDTARWWRLYRGGYTAAEIARKVRRPERTVYNHIHAECQRVRDTTPCHDCGRVGTTGDFGYPTQWEPDGVPRCVVCASRAELARNGRVRPMGHGRREYL